jgi:autotransporter-associated beta strand protein
LLDIQGGMLTVGAGDPGNVINMFAQGCYTNTTCVMQQEGGFAIVQGIQFGGTSGTFSLPATATLTLTGGSLYLGGLGISEKSSHATDSVTFSGGTIGATANWNVNMPINLATNNGNLTFQCSDTNANPYTITLQNGATGAGGLNVTGGGTLALGGTINYSGSTVVSNGTLVLGPSLYPVSGNPVSSGPVTLDGATGTQAPTLSVTENAGQYWSIGTLSFINGGSPAVSFNFGSIAPSTSTNLAPIKVAGNVAFTATPALTISGTAIAIGTYPLIYYTGSVSGTMPTTATLPGYVSSGYITNITAKHTIALVVTGSSYNPALYWGVGNGAWDINTSLNWNQFSSPVKYTEGSAVVFDDSASGSSPITVTLNTTVNPFSVTVNNTTNKTYTITGTGGIAGSTPVTLLGSGSFTLAGTNTYSGGTSVGAAQLNINNGGDNSGANSAIGTGPLTLASGAKLDNTSGSDVTLNPNNIETWNGGFTYLGSSNSLNIGTGNVTMSQNLTLTVSNNSLTVGGSISDGGNNYTLAKNGNGTLTLGNSDTLGGGMTLQAGQLNLGNSASLGNGAFEIDGGSFDNVSGSDISVSPSVVKMFGSFTYLGSSNSIDLGGGQVYLSSGLVINVSNNTLTTEGDLSGGNYPVTKTGAGTWNIIGSPTPINGANGSSMIVNGGTVNLGRTGGGLGVKLSSGSNPGLTVNTNGLVVITAGTQQLPYGAGNVPVTLDGGVLDLNGHSQIVDSLLITNGGTLRGSANYSTLTVPASGGRKLTIGGTNCTFDVPGPELDIKAIIDGNGSLLKTGTGLLLAYSNTTYTGSTIISAGTLELTYPSLATNSLVSVATNAILTLDFSTTNKVGSLIINGVSYGGGVYNSTTDPTYITGPGSLLVVSSAPPINPLPGTIQVSVSGSTLALAWPTNAGWILQDQTNNLSTGLSSNWVDVPGSSSITNANITIVPGNPTVFYRLRSP